MSSVALGVSLLLGCAGPNAPGARLSGLMQCGMPDRTEDTCVVVNPHKTVCHVYVGGSANAPFVYPYALYVGNGTRNLTIVWTLLDRSASFRDKNDGPNFGGNTEFSDGDTTDDSDGDHVNGHATKHYRVTYKNTPTGLSIPYSIKFRTNTGVVAECDPTINNSNM